MSLPHAVIFDMDGLLIDSEPLWQRSEMEVFAALGVRLSREDCLQTIGMRCDAVVQHWLRLAPWDTGAHPVETVEQRIVEAVIGRIVVEGEPLPGVYQALDWAERLPARTALASSSPLRIIQATLATLDLADRFEAVRSAEDEAEGKPHPAVYLAAARELGVAPRDCLALEDSIAGLRSALAAGMRCVMVPDASVVGRAELDEATAVLDSLEQLPTIDL
jgi:sugar-phosphatase